MSNHRQERGSTVVMFTLAVVMMIGVLGLVVDIGWAYFRRQAAQTAADAAVLAAAAAAASSTSSGSFTCGSNGIACQSPTPCGTSTPNPPATNLDSACLYAASFGFSQGGAHNVWVSAGTTSPPPGVPGVQVPYWVTVSVNEQETETFSRIFNAAFLTVGAHATASVFPAPGNCIYALATTGIGLSVNGTVNVSTSCGMYINSSSSGALTAVGGGSINATGAEIDIVGGYSEGSNSQIAPTPITGLNVTTDPLAAMPTPTAGSCTSSGVKLNGNQTRTINPGVYCGDVSVGGQATLTLSPGLYIFQGNLSVSGGASLIGSGATIYMQSGGVGFAGGSIINLTAPTSGTYQGIAIFQDRADANTMTLNGGATQFISGAVYGAAAPIAYTGGTTAQATNTMLVGNTVTFVGNTDINAAPATQYTGGVGGPTLIQ
jgi:Flp pilus assembly protein TadG